MEQKLPFGKFRRKLEKYEGQKSSLHNKDVKSSKKSAFEFQCAFFTFEYQVFRSGQCTRVSQ